MQFEAETINAKSLAASAEEGDWFKAETTQEKPQQNTLTGATNTYQRKLSMITPTIVDSAPQVQAPRIWDKATAQGYIPVMH